MALEENDGLRQGQHLDPEGTPPPAFSSRGWSRRQQEAFLSAEMHRFRDALMLDGAGSLRASILDDLATYHRMTPEECVRRCIDWERWSVEEWQRRPRDTRQSLTEFYRSLQSWSFDLLWYAYLQAEGFAYPVSVVLARSVPPAAPGQRPRHLDFGSGVGVTSQLFHRLGYASDLADISTSMLAFARFRLERRGDACGYLDLNEVALEAGAYDVVTAIDTLAHVPDVAETAAALHRALKPGGLLFANFDVRKPSPENAWHLYAEASPLEWKLRRAGFEPAQWLDNGFVCYRRVDPRGYEHLVRGIRDFTRLRTPLPRAYRRARALAAVLARRRPRHAHAGGRG